MSNFRGYGISERADRQAKVLGLAKFELLAYARQSAPFTHETFNRRYEGFVLRIERGIIEDVGVFKEPRPRPSAVSELLRDAHEMLEHLAGAHWRELEDDELAGLEMLIDKLEQHGFGEEQ